MREPKIKIMRLKKNQIVKVSGWDHAKFAKVINPDSYNGKVEVKFSHDGIGQLVAHDRITPAKVLSLSIKVKWLEMIKEGEKVEEYRAINKYYYSRIADIEWKEGHELLILQSEFRPYDLIRFHVYGREYFGKKDHFFMWYGCDIGTVNPEWAPPETGKDEQFFRISIGEEVDL